jgi:hypothetical protein
MTPEHVTSLSTVSGGFPPPRVLVFARRSQSEQACPTAGLVRIHLAHERLRHKGLVSGCIPDLSSYHPIEIANLEQSRTAGCIPHMAHEFRGILSASD